MTNKQRAYLSSLANDLDAIFQVGKNSLSPELRNEYNHYGIKSDLQIAMTIFFQTYCGYFTSTNLEDALTRKKYIEDNKQLCYGKNK